MTTKKVTVEMDGIDLSECGFADMIAELEKAFKIVDEGYQAFEDGLTRDQCPYEEDGVSDNRACWLDGWDGAKEDHDTRSD